MTIPKTAIARFISLGIALTLSAGAAASTEKPRLEVGQPFPDIALPALDDGRPMSIADFHGQKVVLHVFASW